MTGYHLTSVTRITDLAARTFEVRPVPRARWREGDYVVGEVSDAVVLPDEIEVPSGRLVEVVAGDLVVGALGNRAATLQTVGSWREIGDDLAMDALSIAGVIGRCTSASLFARRPTPLRYCGHVHVDDRPLAMSDHLPAPSGVTFDVPTVLIVGTSMDSGKTVAAKKAVRRLKDRGLRVAAAKLTGVGRFRDVLAMGDAGADWIFDFVDVGLPSTVVPREEFTERLRLLLGLIAAHHPDVLVAEAGASPLEPYNGDVAVGELAAHVRCTVLCANDPYAVVGVMSAFGSTPDLVSGRATATSAGVELIEKLTGVPTLNLLDPRSRPELARILDERLGLSGRG
ncbi:MAG: hypothetical protein M5U14_02115 [Acidimicrobiia bacterium]|nr:hypothetical protein [Acidimicrobiia bacterium]